MSDLASGSGGLELDSGLQPMESIPSAQAREGAEALLSMDVSDDLTPVGLQASEKPVVPMGADELVTYYEKQLAAAQLVQHRLEKQCHQLAEEKLALETSLTVQTSALQQQLVLARDKAERVFAQAEHAQQQVHDAHAAVGEVVDAVTHLAELLDVSDATKELTQSFEAVARSTQRTFQAVAAIQEGAQVVLDLQLEARDACQVSPLFAAVSAGGYHEADAMRKLEEDAIRLRRELDDTRRREQELEAEMLAAQVLFSGLEAEVVSLQHDQAQAAAKLQLSQEELLAARDELITAQQALIAVQSPAAGSLTQGLAKLDAHLVSVRTFLDELSMPQPPVIDALGYSNLQDVASIGSFEGEAEADIEKLKDLISGLQEQLKAKDRELRGARYASLVVHQRAEARSGKPLSDAGDESPISPAQAGSRVTTPTFSYLLAARSQALRSPAAAMGGLSTIQVALIAAEREVLSLRSQLSHRQQHIKLLEQRLLEQSQDIAAMCNRGDALASSPVASRKASFVERRLGLGTEALLPQKAWDFDGVDMNCASGNLAEQMRPQDVRVSKDDDGTSRFTQVPLGEEDESSEGARSETETRKPSIGLQVHVSGDRQRESRESIASLSDLLVERDLTVQQLRAQINEYRAVLAAAAGSRHGQDQAWLGDKQQVHPDAVVAQNIAEFNPRITLEDLPEGYPEWSDGREGGYAGDAHAAGSGNIPAPFRLSSGGPLPFQLAGEMDAVRSAASGFNASGTDAGPDTSTRGPTRTGTEELSRSSSSRVLDVLKRQLEEAAQMLESSQDQLARTTSELTALQGFMDALSKADPSAAQSPMLQAGPVEAPDDVQLSPLRQVSFQEVRARIPAGSGLGPSTNQLNELRAQLRDVMKTIQSGQDHLLAMQAEAGAKEASIARLNEQLQALRAIADAPLVDGVGAVLTSEPISSQGMAGASDRDSCVPMASIATRSRPSSPRAEVNVVTPLSLPISSPSQRQVDADTYTPSLVMNPMFHRDAMGSDTGSDAARMAAFLTNASAAAGEGYFGASLGHAQADPSTTVHRNLLFDEDGVRRTKESGPWQYEQNDPRLSVGTFPESIDSDALFTAGQNVLFASADAQPSAQLEERRPVNTQLPSQLPDASQSVGGLTHVHPVYLRAPRQGMPTASPLRPHQSHEPLFGVMDRSQGGRWPSDDRTDELQASKFPDTISVVSDMESELSQRVTELEEEIMTERNSFADQLIVLRRLKRDLEARVKHLMTELKLKDEQLSQLQGNRGTRGRRSSENLVMELQQTVATLTAELAAKEASIRMRQDRIDDMEQAQSLVTRTVSAEVAAYRRKLEDADMEIEALRKQLAEAEGLAVLLRTTKLQAPEDPIAGEANGLGCSDVNTADKTIKLEDFGRLMERVKILEAELQDATARLDASTRELSSMAREMELCTQQLTEARHQVSAAEAILADERNARQQLGQQLAAAEGTIAALQAGQKQARYRAETHEWEAGQPDQHEDETRGQDALRARVGALEAELQIATQRLNASTRELTATAVDLEASTQRLADASAIAATVEADLEAERRARQQLEQQMAEAVVPRSATAILGQLGSVQMAQEEVNGQLHQAEDQVRTLKGQVEDQSTSSHAIRLVRAGEHLEHLEAALAAAQSVNNGLWSQLGSIASAIGMDVSAVQPVSSSRGTTSTAQDGDVATSVSDVGHMAGQTSAGCTSYMSESQLAYSHLASSMPANDIIGGEHGCSLGGASTALASFGLPTPQHMLHEEYRNSQLSKVWSGPLNFKTALLCGAARSAAAALQTIGDVPISPPSKSVVLRSSMSSQTYSPDTAPGRLGNLVDSPTGDLSLTAAIRSSSESHGNAKQTPVTPLQEGQIPQEFLEQRGLQLLQPGYATSVSSIIFDAAGSQATRDREAHFTVVPDVAAAVQTYLDTLHVDASTVRAQFEADLQLTRCQIAAALKQVAELRNTNEDLMRERENWRGSVRRQSDNQQEQETHDHNLPDIQFANLNTGNVADEQAHDHVGVALVKGCGAEKVALCEDREAGHLDTVKQLAEARAVILDLQQQLSVAEETTALMQRQIAELETSRADLKQQLDASEVDHYALQVKLDAAGHAHMAAVAEFDAMKASLQQQYKDAETGHAMVEQQLEETRAMVKDLQQQLTNAEKMVCSSHQQIEVLGASCVELQNLLTTVEVCQNGLQTQLEEAGLVHTAMQQQSDTGTGLATAVEELQEACTANRSLHKCMLTPEETAAASAQRQVREVETSRAELLQHLEATGVLHSDLQAELNREAGTHAATVVELETANVLLQQQHGKNADSCQAMVEKQLAEAHATIKALLNRLSAAEEVATSTQQQVVQVEASRAQVLQQLDAAEAAHGALQAQLNMAVGANASLQQQYEITESGRITAEKQLVEVRVVVEGLEEHLSSSEKSVVTLQQQVADSELLRAELLQQLEAANMAHGALQAELSRCASTHAAAVAELEAAQALLQQQYDNTDSSRIMAETQLVEARAMIEGLQEELSITKETTASAKQQVCEMEIRYAELLQQLETVEVARGNLQAQLEKAAGTYAATVMELEAANVLLQQQYENTDSSRAMMEKQLVEARATIAALFTRLSTAEEIAASTQQQVVQVEASRAQLLQQLDAAEVAHGALQAQFNKAVGAHAATVAELEHSNASLQQQYEIAESGRITAEKQLAEVRVVVEGLEECLSSSEKSVVSLQQQVIELESSRAELLQQLQEVRTAHSVLQAKLENDVTMHSAAIVELEASHASLQLQYNCAESGRATMEKQLTESHATIKDLEERLLTVEKTVATLQQQVSEVEASRGELLQQVEALEIARSALQGEIDRAAENRAAAMVEYEGTKMLLEQQCKDAENGRAAAEQQLADTRATAEHQLTEARATIEALLEQISVAQGATASMQRHVIEVEASRSELQQQLDAVELSRGALQADLDMAARAHVTAMTEIEAAKSSLQKQYEGAEHARAQAEQQLKEACASIEDLQGHLSTSMGTVTSLQQRVLEVEASRAKLQQQLDAAEESHNALQANFDVAACAHATAVAELEATNGSLRQQYDDAKAGRGMAERQLEEAHAMMEALLEQMSVTQETVASMRQQMIEAEASRAELQQQLDVADARHDVHMHMVVELQAAKELLLQQYTDADAGRATAVQQLEDACAKMQVLEQRMSMAEEMCSAMQQQIDDMEASHTELLQQLKAAEASRDALHAELGEANRTYTATVAELEAAKLALQQECLDANASRVKAEQQLADAQRQVAAADANHSILQADFREATGTFSAAVVEYEAAKARLQQLYENAEAGRVLVEQQLAEAHMKIQHLQDCLIVAEKAAASTEKKVGEVEALRAASEHQLTSIQAQLSVKESEHKVLLERFGALSEQVAAVSTLVEDYERSTDARFANEDVVTLVAGMRASLTSRLDVAGQEAAAHAAHARKLADSLADTQALVAKLERLLAEANAELRATTVRGQELEQLLGGKEKRLLEHELDRRVVAQELEALQKRVAELQVDVESARDNAESVSAHLDEYKVISRQQCREAEQARTDAIMDAAALQEELESLRRALLIATSETEAHCIRLAAVEVELSKVESQMENLQCGIRSSEAQADELRGELAATQYNLMSVRDEHDDAIRQLKEAREEGSLKLGEYQQQLDRLRQELDNAGAQHGNLSQKLAETLAELSAARDEQQAVLVQAMQANTDLEAVKQHLAESQTMLTTRQGELQDMATELVDTRRQMLSAVAERDSVKAQLAEVHAAKQVELLSTMKELGEAQKQLQIALLERDNAATKLAEALTEKQMELLNALKELEEARKELQVALSDRDKAAAKLTEAQIERQTELLGVTAELEEARRQLKAALSECNVAAAKLVEVPPEKQAELQSLTAELAEARKLHQAALLERDAAAAKLVEAEVRLASAREATDAKHAEHAAVVKLLESALAAKDTACSDLSSIRSELLAAVHMLSEIRGERDSLMCELEDMQIEFRGLQDRVSILVQQLAEAQQQAQKASEERDDANRRVAELEGQMVVTGQLLASTHEAIESRRAEHEADVKLLDLALADKASLRTGLEGAQSQVLTALHELSDARTQRDAAMQQLNAVRDVLAVIEEERSSAAAAAVATAAVMREQQRTVEAQQRNLDASRASEASRVAEHLRALELRADQLKQYAEDLQGRLNAAEAHLSSERTEAQMVHSRLELQLTSTRAELESMAADRTSTLKQLAATRAELLQVKASYADLQEKVSSLEQLSELLKGQLDTNKKKLIDAESHVAAERLSAETGQAKAEELKGKLCADLAAAHAELAAIAAQRNALESQLTLVLPTLSATQAEHAAGLRQISHMKGDHAILETHLVPLEEYGKALEQQAENLRQQLSRAEAQHAEERADAQSAISLLEAQLDAVRAELVATASARDVSAQQLEILRSENLEFAAAHGKLEVKLHGLQEHTEHLQRQAGSLQEQLTGAEARLLGERAEAHSARTQAAAVRAELAAVMTERDTLASQAAALRAELASVRVSYESVMQQQGLTVQAKANLEEQLRSHEQRTAQLQSQLRDIVRLQEQLQEAEAKFVAERECRLATERLLATAKAEVSEVHGELAMLRKELAAVTKELTFQQARTESRVGEMQAKVAQARAQASEESDKVYHLQQELAEMKAALKGAERQLLDRDVDAKAMVTGLQDALEATRATLEAERARGEQKAKELQELVHIAITREASAHEKLNKLRDELDAACATQKASQAAAETDITSLKEELLNAQRALHSAKQAALAQEAGLKASLQAANKAAAFSQQQVACLDAQVMAARTVDVEAQRALAEAQHSMDRIAADAAGRIAGLEASLAEAHQAIADLETRQKRAEDASRTAEDEVVVMGGKLREEQERASLLEPRIETLSEEVAALQAELSNARTALSRYKAYAVDAEAEIQELRNAADVSSEENVRLQQQLDQLVEQLRRQTQQLRAAETDAAQLRQEVAAMNLMGARRSQSSSRGKSGERRHGSAGRAVAGGRAGGGSASILEDSVNPQQLLILRKTQHTSRHPSPAVMAVSSGSNSTVSRTGEAGQRTRPTAGSMDPRPPAAGIALEQRTVDTAADPGLGTRSLSPASLLQKRLTDEATQLRWEVVADSSRIRELQEKRAGGVYLNRAEVAEMELLTARLGAHHARISAIMDTVKLARGQQPQGVMEPAVARANTTQISGVHESCRLKSPPRAIFIDVHGNRNACQQAPSPQQGRDVLSDLEFPDQPRQQPVFHPHPPAHPPVQRSFGEVGSGGIDEMSGLDARAVVQCSPQAAPPVGGSRGFDNGGKSLETPSRMRFFDLETRAEPAELPRTTFGTNELHLAEREAFGRRDDVRPMGTPTHSRDMHRLGDATPNQEVDLMRGGVHCRGNNMGQVQNANDSISPHALGFVYGTFPSPSSQSARSTLAIINAGRH
ncbi:hypothetical protein Vretimale_12613 [Volvox reticuliferus]|uniref:Uncharacterized protein n=1 Tax=Volvox reticuliferus TaxID=1737510 RepID=A0A8J4FEY5_9CHLO|nr:hypothetical protein Vretifemale_234 [Volvox reticuliferus]GIM08585.1 hypothetical protein Vretimale_12613 [Volvox reticuliferus]